MPLARRDVLAAVASTSARHASDPRLAAVGLSAAGWRSFFQALIEAESGYDPAALSPKGAYGLGQLMPATARALGVDRRDPAQNLDGAARYVLGQLATFGAVDLALAAYNAGPDRVRQYRGIPPFAETRAYVARVTRIWRRLEASAAGTDAAALPGLRRAAYAPLP